MALKCKFSHLAPLLKALLAPAYHRWKVKFRFIALLTQPGTSAISPGQDTLSFHSPTSPSAQTCYPLTPQKPQHLGQFHCCSFASNIHPPYPSLADFLCVEGSVDMACFPTIKSNSSNHCPITQIHFLRSMYHFLPFYCSFILCIIKNVAPLPMLLESPSKWVRTWLNVYSEPRIMLSV